MKKCKKCLIGKDLTFFSRKSNKKDGYDSVCKECDILYRKNVESKLQKELIVNIDELKICKYCNVEKKITDFKKSKRNVSGYGPVCKKCHNQDNKEYSLIIKQKNLQNKEIEIERKICGKCKELKDVTEFHSSITSKDKLQNSCKSCRQASCKDSYSKHKDDEHKVQDKIRRAIEREEFLKLQKAATEIKRKERRRERFRSDPEFRLKFTLRKRFYDAIKRTPEAKRDSCLDLLGCSVSFLLRYLSENYYKKTGILLSVKDFPSKWYHIDHIKPCKSFNLLDFDQQKECFRYTNLQILSARENLKKGDRYVKTT